MKKIVYVIAFSIITISCTTPAKQIDVTQADDIAEYALSLDSAKVYINRYDSLFRAHFNDTIPVRSFTVRAADLLESLGVSPKDSVKFSHVRIYLGMDYSNKFRLFLTPVTGARIDQSIAGRDSILSGPYTRGKATGEGIEMATTNGEYVMDFSSPCPTTCPESLLSGN